MKEFEFSTHIKKKIAPKVRENVVGNFSVDFYCENVVLEKNGNSRER